MTETTTRFFIQMQCKIFGPDYKDVEGQLTGGYESLAGASGHMPNLRNWEKLAGHYGCPINLRIVERVATERTVEEITIGS